MGGRSGGRGRGGYPLCFCLRRFFFCCCFCASTTELHYCHTLEVALGLGAPKASSLHFAKLKYNQLLLHTIQSQGADTDDGLPFTVFSHSSEDTCKCLCVFPLRLIGYGSSKYSDTSVRFPVRLRNRLLSASGLCASSTTWGNANEKREALRSLPSNRFDKQRTNVCFFLRIWSNVSSDDETLVQCLYSITHLPSLPELSYNFRSGIRDAT